MAILKDDYLTLSAPVSGELKVLGSRFIARCFPAESPARVQELLETLRNDFPDATHRCYAYRLGVDGSHFRAVDAGEPSGTAGRPILSAIERRGLTDVLVVVVRYFGGTKLGVGGLTRAYAQAAGDALAGGTVMQKFVEASLEVAFPHPRTSAVMRIVARCGARIVAADYGEGVNLTLAIRVSRADELAALLVDETGGQARVTRVSPPSGSSTA
jgi:uncharacterized YigZ family protein